MRVSTDLTLGGAALALGLLLAGGSLWIDSGFGYDRIGPRTMPWAVALGLLLLGAALLAAALRRPAPQAEPPQRAAAGDPIREPVRWNVLALLAAAGAVFLLLAGSIGFVAAASLQFWLVAQAFHDRRPLRDGVAAVLLAVAVYAAFARGLGLALPAGPLESLLHF